MAMTGRSSKRSGARASQSTGKGENLCRTNTRSLCAAPVRCLFHTRSRQL